MAALPCALKTADSCPTTSNSSSLDSLSGHLVTFHRPYESNDTLEQLKIEEKREESSRTDSSKENMNLIYTNTFHKSQSLLFPYKLPYENAAMYDQKHRRTNSPLPDSHHFDRRSPPPLEKISRNFFYKPYSTPSPHQAKSPKFFGSSHLQHLSSSLTKVETDKSEDLLRSVNDKTIASQIIRPFTKARMKYTPVRGMLFTEESVLNEQACETNGLIRNNHLDKELTENLKEVIRSKPIPSLHCSDLSTTDKVFARRLSVGRYETESSLAKLHQHRRLSESLNESKRNGSSAFSVIHPHFQRMYSTESGYSSDPSSNGLKSLHQTFDRTEMFSRCHTSHTSTSTAFSSNHSTELPKEHTVSKLHVSDEASKEALKAFDAHVEKMMARTSYESKMNVHEEAKATNSQSGVQCSAIDSTQSNDSPKYTSGGGLLGLTQIANEHLGQAIAKEKKRSKNNNCLHLWQFLRSVLEQEKEKPNKCIEWTNRERGEFRLIKTAVIADLWGQSKNRKCMTYEKMARAMRYYYKMKILEKVPHKRLHFRFGEKMLPKVLDSNCVRNFRRSDSNMKEVNGAKPFFNTTSPLSALKRGDIALSSPGVISLSGRMSQSEPLTPMTPMTPMTPLTPASPSTEHVNRKTSVIRNTNFFFPPDLPLSTSLHTPSTHTVSMETINKDVTKKVHKNVDDAVSESTPSSSPLSVCSGGVDEELVVDID